MSLIALSQKLISLGQDHLLHYFQTLPEEEQHQLLKQIDELNTSLFMAQRQLVLTDSKTLPKATWSAFKDFSLNGSKDDRELGRACIEKGEVGCLVVAGGQGSRLNFSGPKGMFPITVVKHKTLFQLLAEKVKAASVQARRKLPIAIMTSPSNHHETTTYFADHHYFGLDEDQVTFFSQGELPFLNQEGNLFLESPSKIAEGSDGNGTALQHFVEQGIWSAWQKKGVLFLNYIFIDNPLADPFDAEFIGHHKRKGGDLAIKCVERRDAQEKVGVIVNTSEGVRVVEYSEMPPEEFAAVTAQGALKHFCANISLFSFTMEFVRQVVSLGESALPLHRALKNVKIFDGHVHTTMAWKFEKFIFDVLPFAKGITALLYPREVCFAPLKNAQGLDSVNSVKEALQQYDRTVWTDVTGLPCPERVFELSPDFYYPTPKTFAKWKDQPLPNNSYIGG